MSDIQNFSWDMYEGGYNGKSMRLNRSVVTRSPKDKVYSHEVYAQDLYDAYTGVPVKMSPKDDIKDTLHTVVDIRPGRSGNVVFVDTDGGGTAVVDLNKEKEYIKIFNIDDVKDFMETIKVPEYKKIVLDSNPVVKVMEGGRHSLWGGHIARTEADFMREIKNPTTAYYANVIESNNGGYIVMVDGIKCFMPGSMAAPGILTDFDSMIGKTVPVMIVNYIKKAGFIVSYKRYLAKVLPSMIEEELSVGMQVSGKITGFSTNGIFIQFDNKDGEPVFSGLMHRDEMSPSFERQFDERDMEVGGAIDSFIHAINRDGDRIRIVLGDTPLDDEEFVKKKNSRPRQYYGRRQRYER